MPDLESPACRLDGGGYRQRCEAEGECNSVGGQLTAGGLEVERFLEMEADWRAFWRFLLRFLEMEADWRIFWGWRQIGERWEWRKKSKEWRRKWVGVYFLGFSLNI